MNLNFPLVYPLKNPAVSTPTPRWSTATFGDSAHDPGVEVALGEHLTRCMGAHQRWFALRCLAESAHGFIVARFVTSLVVLTLLIGLLSLAV